MALVDLMNQLDEEKKMPEIMPGHVLKSFLFFSIFRRKIIIKYRQIFCVILKNTGILNIPFNFKWGYL